MSFDRRSHDAPGVRAAASTGPAGSPGKQTLTAGLSVPTHGPRAAGGTAAPGEAQAAAFADPTATASRAGGDDKWTTLFHGEPSRAVHALARVAVPKGLHVRTAPGSSHFHATIPFNTLVQIERTTLGASAVDRWAYVVAPNAGAAGFVEEGFLMWDPPEPSASLHEVKKGETLGGIVERHYGSHIGEGHDERLYCQAVYFSNRDVPGVKLAPIDLSTVDKLTRSKKEQETLRIYKGVQVISGDAIWMPSNAFVAELQKQGKITSGQTDLTKAFEAAEGVVEDFVNSVEYGAGILTGLVDGVFVAFRDLASGAIQTMKSVIDLVSGNIGPMLSMAKHWLEGFVQLWKHGHQVAVDFLAKWNDNDSFQRGKFRGEVVGWLITNVVIVILTSGEASEGVLAGIATRFPDAVKALRLVSDLGDVKAYARELGKGLELPEKQQKYLNAQVPSEAKIANSAQEHAKFRNEWKDAHHIKSISAQPGGSGGKPRKFEFKVASEHELMALADVLHQTDAWILHDTVKLSPRGLHALKLAVQDHPHHGFDDLFSGRSITAHATVANQLLLVTVRA
jgi:hypothetical protein